MSDQWRPFEPDVHSAFSAENHPIQRLVDGDSPAIILRQVFPRTECEHLIRLLIARELMFEPWDERIEKVAIPASRSDRWTKTGTNPESSPRRRIDIGTSLGNYGDRQDEFFRRAAETHQLFDELFCDRPNPIQVIHDSLQRLIPHKRVMTAREADGRQYGPAIFRVHYGGYTYPPHFDSVRHRERRTDYAVYRFEHQLAGVMCLQNATRDERTAQAIIHQQQWNPHVDPHLKAGAFTQFAKDNAIANAVVELEPGDLYFFNTGMIHEVPGVEGNLPRVVLAVFLGVSIDDEIVMVWS